MECIIPPTYSWSALWSLPSWICLLCLQKEASQSHPYWTLAPFHAQSRSFGQYPELMTKGDVTHFYIQVAVLSLSTESLLEKQYKTGIYILAILKVLDSHAREL